MLQMSRAATTNKTPTSLREIYTRKYGVRPDTMSEIRIRQAAADNLVRRAEAAADNLVRRARAAANMARIEQRMRNRQPAVDAFFTRARNAENRMNRTLSLNEEYNNITRKITNATTRTNVLKLFRNGARKLHPDRGGNGILFGQLTNIKNARLGQL